MIRDPLPEMQRSIATFLKSAGKGVLSFDAEIAPKISWRPHLFQKKEKRGWYLHPVQPLSKSWAERIVRAKEKDKKLRIGVAASEQLLEDEEFLQTCHELNASIVLVKIDDDSIKVEKYYNPSMT